MRPFWQELILQLVGPAFAVVFGTAILGLAAQHIARTTQDKREILRIRDGFISDTTSAAVGLYVATQRYWRARTASNNGLLNEDALAEERGILDQQYRDSRVAGEVLEGRIYAYYADPEPRRRMHQVMDLLTVRYFQVIGRDTDSLLEANAGSEHSGLEIDQLRRPMVVLDNYRWALLQLIADLVDKPVSISGVRERPQVPAPTAA
jgi:hypothetical protein